MNEYQIAVFIGLSLFVSWIGVYILSWIVTGVWCWVDESKVPNKNPIIKYLMVSVLKCEDDGDNTAYYQKGKLNIMNSEGGGVFLAIGGTLLLFPLISMLLFKLYVVTLSIGLAILIAYLARYARRNHKAFDKHIDNPNAHQQKEKKGTFDFS